MAARIFNDIRKCLPRRGTARYFANGGYKRIRQSYNPVYEENTCIEQEKYEANPWQQVFELNLVETEACRTHNMEADEGENYHE